MERWRKEWENKTKKRKGSKEWTWKDGKMMIDNTNVRMMKWFNDKRERNDEQI